MPCGGATYVFWPVNKGDGHVAIVGDRGFLCKFPPFLNFLLFVDIFKLGLKGPNAYGNPAFRFISSSYDFRSLFG